MRYQVQPFATNFTNNVNISALNVETKILSGGIDLGSIINQSNTGDINVNTTVRSNSGDWNETYTNVSSNSALWFYENIAAGNSYYTIQEFAASNPQNIYKGYTVTLFDGRVYIFAGTDPSNANQYLEVNANPITPIYQEVSLYNRNSAIIDTYDVSEFKSAKYTLQVETTFNNDIYYSEINVVGSILSQVAIASEYGQISTSDIILGYQAIFDVNQVKLVLLFSSDSNNTHSLIVRGHRTNFFKI